ncbi:MAG: TIGR04282 family arsenosugar biosynthesis glycosyltransferase [Rubrivivax sp.]|nr:TIGR04282 family arsenosugar biosynthesis glycosyltransferase [Rubrivivax sp.]
MSPGCGIAVLAKAPRPGYAKTRLIPALGAEGAAALAEQLLEHAVAQAVAAGLGPVAVWAAPDTTHAAFGRLALGHGVDLCPQGEGDLGARMARVFETAWAAAPGPLLLMGTDAPALDAAMLRDAATALRSCDAVFVPAFDGGYALIGLRRWAPPLRCLFDGMAWSTARVMADTRERLAAAGLRHTELPGVPDIDVAADLKHLPAGWSAGAAVTMPDSTRCAFAMSDLPHPAESAEPAVPEPAPHAETAATPPLSSDLAPTEPAAAAQAVPPAAPDTAAGTAPEEAPAREAALAADVAPASEAVPAGRAALLPLPAPATAPATAPADLSLAACAARLAELFPALFGAGRALPIKLRIQNDIQQRAPGVFTRKSLSPFLHRYTTSTAYLKGLVNLPHRFDLDGAPAGDIDDVHRQAAAAELERRRGLFEAKRAAERAAANEARRAAEAAARQQQAAEDQARRERAALLRAYETSTLTRANFCVLKGIPEAELDGRLHQAWLEREQRAQEMRPAAETPAHGQARPPQRSRPGPRREARPDAPAGERAAGGQPGAELRADGRPPRPPRPQGAPGPRPSRPAVKPPR